MPTQSQPLSWLESGQDFPPARQAWGEQSGVPGLLAAGGVLDVDSLRRAYSKGIFPWYSEGQPILWWSPNPRMVLDTSEFRLHTSLRKTLQKFRKTQGCEIRINSAFEKVVHSCSNSLREGQAGTWIVPEMIAAYSNMHKASLAHSVETWVNDKLVGGLYCVALGKFVFGESMFSESTNASKIALAYLIGFCRHHGIQRIDCQQNTLHLAFLGAREISRDRFLELVAEGIAEPAPPWEFDDLYWDELLPFKPAKT
jgi:leucyl/phenylalanyl-tRNA--protein transferase